MCSSLQHLVLDSSFERIENNRININFSLLIAAHAMRHAIRDWLIYQEIEAN